MINIFISSRDQRDVLTFTKAALLRDSLRRRLVPRSLFTSDEKGVRWFWVLKRFATVALARRACAATGISDSGSSSMFGKDVCQIAIHTQHDRDMHLRKRGWCQTCA